MGRKNLVAVFCAMVIGAWAYRASAQPAAQPLGIEQLLKQQALIGHALARIAKQMKAENPSEQRIQAILQSLSVSETVKAIEALEKIARAKTAEERQAELLRVRTSQDRIIQMLEKILGVIGQLRDEQAKPSEEERGSDMPSDDVREKLKALSEKLKEFLKEQKKVIDGTTSLAKMPVEEFTPEQEEQLKQLEATEDQWSKFLKETHSDLSKMAEQDFSNPALLEEIVEIYTEIDKAKDALSKKTIEIAVPMEEAGAELASELNYNLERWLLDEPDRIRWQMEEPLEDYEIPMAELPEELQDIIGELMEQEDDLMEDIEDATSGWADSLDKGAGWDAMDGPISNFSARGVTGNMLPNTSEISGRSGEGRTGKSAGEFVEKTAVGKGGRRTPTRLTPDAFEKGVVDDRSPEAAGGSTGGGKISGAGSEGLEGPIPPQMQQQLKALAGRQAQIRNKAERTEVRFKAVGYPTEPLADSIRTMKAMEDALKDGRYGRVARMQHQLIGDLQDTRSFLAGEARVSRDRTVNLPPELQEQILQALQEPSPKEYEALLRAYFEALSNPR